MIPMVSSMILIKAKKRKSKKKMPNLKTTRLLPLGTSISVPRSLLSQLKTPNNLKNKNYRFNSNNPK